VERVRHDTVWQNHTALDSIYIRDSVWVNRWVKGETIYIEKVASKLQQTIERRRDTIYKSRVDSVPMPYPVVKLIEKELSWWQKARMHTGEVVLSLIGGGVVWAIVRRRIFGG
jgi:hypothetical protein